VLVERRSPAPLVPLDALRVRGVVGPNVGIFLQSMVGLPWLYVLTLYLQDALARSPLEAGLLFLPMTLTSVVAAPAAGRLVPRLGTRTTAASGLALSAVGLLLKMGMSSEGGFPPVLAGMVVGEAGFMLCNVALTIAGSGGAGEDRKGLSAGLLNTSIQLGDAWSLGIVATVVAAATIGGEAASSEALIGGLRWGALACVGFAALALPVVLFGLPGGKEQNA
jgi:MFS family permease